MTPTLRNGARQTLKECHNASQTGLRVFPNSAGRHAENPGLFVALGSVGVGFEPAPFGLWEQS